MKRWDVSRYFAASLSKKFAKVIYNDAFTNSAQIWFDREWFGVRWKNSHCYKRPSYFELKRRAKTEFPPSNILTFSVFHLSRKKRPYTLNDSTNYSNVGGGGDNPSEAERIFARFCSASWLKRNTCNSSINDRTFSMS